MTTPFADRHIGLRPDDVATMLALVGYESLEALMAEAVPAAIRTESLELPAAASEQQAPPSCARSPRATGRPRR